MNCGIYEIYNKITNQIYIGSSINTKFRINSHKSRLSKGTHPNKYLQSSYNKYGDVNFEFNQILTCSEKELEFYEEQFISLQFSNIKKYGYNLREVAKSMRGYKHSKETKKKALANKKKFKHTEDTKKLIGLKAKGRKPSDYTIFKSVESRKIKGIPKKRKQLECLDTVTKEILIFESRKAAAEYLKCRHTTIVEGIKHNRLVFKRYKFTSL